MNGFIFTVIVAFSVLTHTLPTWAGGSEPPFCDLGMFQKMEIENNGKNLQRLKVYKIGTVILAGLGVGESPASEVKDMAREWGGAGAKDNYCTWYYNEGNTEAEQNFSWKSLPKPDNKSKTEDIYTQTFLKHITGMAQCLREHHYVALGCNGMRHRGPTIFGMLLAFGGCSAKNANAIVNQVWGLNGVPFEARLKMIQRAEEMGNADPEAQRILQEVLIP